MRATVQTSALAGGPDILDTSPELAVTLTLTLHGTLVRDAEVRVKPVGDGGHVLPVLCLDIASEGGLHHLIHAEQIYPEAARKAAEIQATKLRKGMRVTVTTPLDDMRFVLPHIVSVAVDPS